jgi:Ca2+-binding RTX toxin-like protein
MAAGGRTSVAIGTALAALLVLAVPATSGPVAFPTDPVTCLGNGVVKIRSAGKYSHLVDRVEVGYRAADNTLRVHYGGSSKDEGPYETTEDCALPGDTWRRIDATLDSGADTIRLDAKGLPAEFKPVPGSIASRIYGGGTRDVLLGHAGPDELRGGASFDRLVGFRGGDVLVGGERQDTLLAGSGDDVVRAADGGKLPDKVRCGGGTDLAVVDRVDDRTGCEKVTRR